MKPIQAFIAVLVTYNNEKDPIKNEIASVHNIIYLFFKRSRAANLEVCDGIWQKFKLTQAFMVVLVTHKNDEDSSENESTRMLTPFLPCLILLNFKPVQAFIAGLVTFKNEKDPIKNEIARVAHNIIHLFFKRSRGANSVDGDGIWQKFKLIHAFIVVLV